MKMEILKELRAKIRGGFDNYRLSILFALPVALLLMIISLGISATLGIEDLVKTSTWVVDLIVVPAFIGRLVSASSYLARLCDAWSMRQRAGYAQLNDSLVVTTTFYGRVPAERPIGSWERWGTTLGVLLGVGVGVSAIVLHASVPLFASLWYVAYPLYVGGFIGILAGLFNRLGIGIDNNRDKVEVILMAVGAVLGFALGATLLATSTASLAIIAGVTPFVAGASFPAVVAGVIFVLIAASVYASAADYLSKSISYLRALWDEDFAKSTVHPKKFEYVGSLLGVVVGLGIGLSLVFILPMGSGVVAAAVGSLVVLTAVGVVGGLFARTARLADRLWGGGGEVSQQAASQFESTSLPKRSPAGAKLEQVARVITIKPTLNIALVSAAGLQKQ